MKLKYLLFGVALISLTSFSNDNLDTKYIKATKKSNAIFQTSDGEKLIAKSDCVGCHKLDKKLIGPSYLDIAKKYPSNEKNVAYLSGKIIKGGSGVWGTIPMAAHTSLKKDDAKSMAKYILSLKK
ncbi:MAG: c-type cytochrome [Flavobacterium sp.]|jgi:cytochrome c|uniref:C-type cytochrome n=2 Tax=Flavobacteriaceae TaxID=49546 RepID=A0ABT6VD76_9FLAO|nr:c-type cytochrome [Flavobacterium algoritolerans]MDI5895856.1 c-type cytochrome [Flavobacterium algoritolerans]MDP3681427.1 c-type cytochrome [Flavobacterium sp.]MDZ4330951.1 c-type cytochrome [Flavobacterium sp.]